MGSRTNNRYLEGKQRGCPMAAEAGRFEPLTRWIHVRDGIEDVLSMLPSAEHSVAARLQEAWATASKRVEDLQRKEVPEWVLPI